MMNPDLYADSRGRWFVRGAAVGMLLTGVVNALSYHHSPSTEIG